METFDFPYHLRAVKHPESGNRMQFGNSYMFSSEPSAPDQRIFTLFFKGMKYFQRMVNGELLIDLEGPHPQINVGRMEKFYWDHRLWKKFKFPHPIYGNIIVKFNKPLEIPKGVEGGDGSVEAFSVELIEIP